jgi:hypothetical protein
MSEHSKRPWTAKKIRASTVLLDGNGNDILFVGLADGAPYATFRNDADTRLIVAAPDMFAALNEASESVSRGGEISRKGWQMIEAALAKASE